MKRELTYFNQADQRIKFSYLKDISLAEAIYAPNLELPKHTHHNAGFCFTLQGGYTELNDRRLLECRPSYVKFNPAGDTHSNLYGNKEVHIFVIELKSEWLNRVDANALLERTSNVFSKSSISWLMMKLRKEFHSGDAEACLAIEGIILEIIAEASRNQKKTTESKHPRWLEQAKEFIDDCFSEPLTLSIIAKSVGVHAVYLANSFRKHYQCSIGEYLRKRRVEVACQKLSNSQDQLVEIAFEAGFSNQAHFSKIFKQITGMTPAKYRSLSR